MEINIRSKHEATVKRFQKIKKRYGLKYNVSVLQLLLSNEAERTRAREETLRTGRVVLPHL